MAVCYLLLGSNLGNKEKNLTDAISQLALNYCKIIKISSLYESEAWGYNDNNTYYNLALKADTKLSAEDLLDNCLNIEKLLGRKRSSDNYEARIIDIDILFYDDNIIHSLNLEIPHPRLPFRKFALIPVNEIEADFLHPQLKKTIRQILDECGDTGWVKKIKAPLLTGIFKDFTTE